MYFEFQESKPFAGELVDPKKLPRIIQAKNEVKARQRLPQASVGRVWILTGERTKRI